MKYSLAFFIIVIGFWSCTIKPTACIQAESNIILPGEAVEFVNCTENGDRYLWDFGDGFTSEKEHPVHFFLDNGNYEVKLTAYGKHGKRGDETTYLIQVRSYLLDTITIDQLDEYFDWDDDLFGYPDCQVVFYPENDPQRKYYTDIYMDVNSSKVPITFAAPFDIEISNEDWIFKVFDVDSADSQLIFSTMFKPYEMEKGQMKKNLIEGKNELILMLK